MTKGAGFPGYFAQETSQGPACQRAASPDIHDVLRYEAVKNPDLRALCLILYLKLLRHCH